MRLAVKPYASALAALSLAGCFRDVPGAGSWPHDQEATTSDTSFAIDGQPRITETGDEPGTTTSGDPGSDPDATDTDTVDSSALCGNGVLEGGEDCDDNNTEPDDGCDPFCRAEPAACAPSAWTVGEDLEAGIGVCQDREASVCEEDFAELCGLRWHLCSALEHRVRNDTTVIELGGTVAVGTIRCRAQGGSGHYTVRNFAVDGPDNCEIGSSRADCPTNLGCNESMHAALCCAPIPTCGNGVVDSPLEECDDGNLDPYDECSNHCANRRAGGPSC